MGSKSVVLVKFFKNYFKTKNKKKLNSQLNVSKL